MWIVNFKTLSTKRIYLTRDIVIWRIYCKDKRETAMFGNLEIWKSGHHCCCTRKINLSLWPSAVAVSPSNELYILSPGTWKRNILLLQNLKPWSVYFVILLLRLLQNISHPTWLSHFVHFSPLCDFLVHKNYKSWFWQLEQGCFRKLIFSVRVKGRTVLNWD